MYIFEKPIENFVKEEQLPFLIRMLDSNEPCMSVGLMVSSTIRLESTVGDEAAFLILGYRAKKYPVSLNSRAMTSEEKDELRRWWNEE